MLSYQQLKKIKRNKGVSTKGVEAPFCGIGNFVSYTTKTFRRDVRKAHSIL